MDNIITVTSCEFIVEHYYQFFYKNNIIKRPFVQVILA